MYQRTDVHADNGGIESSPSAWDNSASAGRIVVKFDIWVFFENLLRKLKFH